MPLLPTCLLHPECRCTFRRPTVSGLPSLGVLATCAVLMTAPSALRGQYASPAGVTTPTLAMASAPRRVDAQLIPTRDARRFATAETGRGRRAVLGAVIGGVAGGAIGYGIAKSACDHCDDPAPIVLGAVSGTVIGAVIGGVAGARWRGGSRLRRTPDHPQDVPTRAVDRPPASERHSRPPEATGWWYDETRTYVGAAMSSLGFTRGSTCRRDQLGAVPLSLQGTT